MRPHPLLVGLLLLSATNAQSLSGPTEVPSKTTSAQNTILPSPPPTGPAVRDPGRLPLSFERNQGQTNAQVRFLTHTADSTLFLTPTEAVFTMALQRPSPLKKGSGLLKGRLARKPSGQISRVALRMQMVGADPRAASVAQQPLAGHINYFLGSDPHRWHAGVPTFGRAGFHQVYPGIDMVYYGNRRHLEYDFVVAPHADPGQINLHFAGAQGVRLDAEGDLLERTQGRELKWRKPAVYQRNAAGKHSVAGRFQLKRLSNGQTGVSFALGRYDTDRTLVIDPVLLYSTYLGGTGVASDNLPGGEDVATSIAVDQGGNAYVTGLTVSLDFPITSGAYQKVNLDQYTVFVTKFNPTGTALVYSTFLGGSTQDSPGGIAVDSAGNAYVTGYTESTDFPTTPGAFQARGAVFVTKLNPTGSALIYSTCLGGGTTTTATGIAVDTNGNAYVEGYTQDLTFPVTPGAFQTQLKHTGTPPYNVFVTKFNTTGTALVYSTYLGGTGTGDEGSAIAVDSSGDAFIVGGTSSSDFPVTPGAFQTKNKEVEPANGGSGFVTKLNPTGSALIYSTYLGGTGQIPYGGDAPESVAIDGAGNAYVAGGTVSKDFPTTPGAFQPGFLSRSGDNQGVAFVTKLNPTGTALVYSTYLEGSGGSVVNGGDNILGIAIDAAGTAYVAGSTTSLDFPTAVGSFQRTHVGAGTTSGFITRLNATGSALIYSTYLGGSGYDNACWAIALDPANNAYVAGETTSRDFPVTPGVFQPTHHGPAGNLGIHNAFVTKLAMTPIFPDFNNDGFTDLLIQNTSTAVIASWFMEGSQWNGGAYFSIAPRTDLTLVGAGDFSGNGGTTLVLQSRQVARIAFYYTAGANNATITGVDYVSPTPDDGWRVVGIGDFNGDGKSDLVFQNQTTHQVAIWFMNGAVFQGGALLPYTPPAGWSVVGVGDFNADGFPDIAFQNQTTGQIALWYMNSTNYIGGTVLSTVPAAGWKVVAVGDYNGDGSADLVFQNQTTNQAVVWYLQNGAFAGGALLSLAPPAGWQIVGPR